jgi:threonine dehydrogenase-like Zn-dependent dehydrogenase
LLGDYYLWFWKLIISVVSVSSVVRFLLKKGGKMKAAVFKEKGRIAVEDIPDPRPEADEIILKVKYCAICGSDLHRYAHGMMSPGLVMGHEYSGEVAEVGRNVRGFKTGDRLIRCTGQPNPGREFLNLPPRFTAKTRGFLPQKPGAYAQYVAFNAANAMRIPDGVSDLDASLVEPLTVAVHAARQSKIVLGDKVVVFGAGPIGLFAQQCAGLSGAAEVCVSEVNPARLRAASRLGAKKAINPLREDILKEIEAWSGIGADAAFECAGAQSTLQQALESVRMGGRVMLIALAWENVDCFPVDWVGREVELKACYEYFNSEWVVAMGLMETKKVKTEPMVTRVIPLADIDAMFKELLRPGTDEIQVVVECN